MRRSRTSIKTSLCDICLLPDGKSCSPSHQRVRRDPRSDHEAHILLLRILYNHKYGRIGHLFQERFKSQPVGDWDYFLTLLRYIHQNPLKPHLVSSLREYRWSSWLEYIGQEKNAFCATNVVLGRISLEELSTLIEEPLTENEKEGLLDIEETPVQTYFSDEEIWHVLTNLCGKTTSAEFQQLSRPQQKHYL